MPPHFQSIVGAERVRGEEGETLDGVPLSCSVRPASAAEAAACLSVARETGGAVIAKGAGTKLGWGNPPRCKALVALELGDLDAPLAVEPEEGIATVGAGVRLEVLAEATRRVGMRTVLGGGFSGATVGGSIAADPCGVESSPDQKLRGDLLGLEVALPNGTLARCGGRVVKNVTGFDLVRLYCGSLGTLGVVTQATLRVRPLPEQRSVLRRRCADLEESHLLAAALISERVEPRGAALLPEAAGVSVLWLVEGTSAEVEARSARVEGERVGEEAWAQVQERASGSRASGEPVRLRLGARGSDSLEVCSAVIDLGGRGALRIALPHLGLVWAELGEDALERLWSRAEAERWLLMIERAERGVRERFDAFGPAPETLPLMRAVKQRFDPDGVLAPGRFLGRI